MFPIFVLLLISEEYLAKTSSHLVVTLGMGEILNTTYGIGWPGYAHFISSFMLEAMNELVAMNKVSW